MRNFAAIPPPELRSNFEAHLVDWSGPNWIDRTVSQLNAIGFATFEGIDTSKDLVAISSFFGQIRRYDLTDDAGVTTMVTGDALGKSEGRVMNPQGEQALHTDGSTVPEPPDLGFVYCSVPDPAVARANVFASGKGLYEQLTHENPELLSLLHTPVDCGGGTKSGLFTSHPDGMVSVRLRPVDPVMAYPAEVLKEVDSRLRHPALLTGINLGRGEGVVFNNKSVFHGVGASKAIGRVAQRVIVTADPEIGLVPGFFPEL